MRPWRRFMFPALLATAAFGSASSDVRAAGCQELKARIEAKVDAEDFAGIEALHADLQRLCTSTENPDVAYCTSRRIALGFHDAAAKRYERGEPLVKLASLAEKGASFGKPWQLLSMQGEIAAAKGDRSAAALYFQLALNDLDEGFSPKLCPYEQQIVDEWPAGQLASTVAALLSQAEVQLSLADEYVPPPPDKAGKPAGIFKPSFKGISPKARTAPIEFVFKSVELTPKGKAAFDALVSYLGANDRPGLTFTGHTDGVGGAAFNCDLSARRLAALGAALKSRFPKLKVELIPQGEHEPRALPDEAGLTSAQIDQLNRRVRLVEGSEKPERKCK